MGRDGCPSVEVRELESVPEEKKKTIKGKEVSVLHVLVESSNPEKNAKRYGKESEEKSWIRLTSFRGVKLFDFFFFFRILFFYRRLISLDFK